MRIQTTVGALVAALISAFTSVASGQTTNNSNGPASAASASSPGTIGAMNGVAPTPAIGSSGAAPKLVRHTPGTGAVTQPSSSSPARTGASSPTDKMGGK
jgi:hypothetical protein